MVTNQYNASFRSEFLDYECPTGINAGKSGLEIFNSSFEKTDGCWNWSKKLGSNKYGMFCFRGKHHLAHRLSLYLHTSQDINGLLVCHKCDNRKCVNPEHLFVGSQSDNLQDAKLKGRLKPASGPNSGKTDLSLENVVTIFQMRASGMLFKDIAATFNTHQNCISRIVSGKRWNAHTAHLREDLQKLEDRKARGKLQGKGGQR
jgi:hypothetical protein